MEESKPMVVQWFHQIILEVFLIWQKAKYVQLKGMLQNFVVWFFFLSFMACEKIGPFSSCMKNTKSLTYIYLPDKEIRHSHVPDSEPDWLAGIIINHHS